MEENRDLGFVLIPKDDGTYLKIENVKVSSDLIEEYIEIAGVRNYDRDSLRMAIASNKQTTLRFSRDIIEELDEQIKVNISNDKLEAYVKFYPPSEKGKYLTKSDITKVPGFYFHKVNKMKIRFNDSQKINWCIDGERLDDDSREFEIKVLRNVRLLIPKKNIKNLFIDE